jgi:hypothetical protein
MIGLLANHGSASRQPYWSPWPPPSVAMSWPGKPSSPTTPRSSCRHPAPAGPRPPASGPMSATSDPLRGLLAASLPGIGSKASWPSMVGCRSTGRPVRVHDRPQGPAPRRTSGRLSRLGPCRRLFGLQRTLSQGRDPRGRLPRPHPAQVRRHRPKSGIADRRGGHQAHRRALWRRETGARRAAREARRTSPGVLEANPRRVGNVVAKPAAAHLRQVRARQGDPLRPDPPEKAATLSRPRPARSRQQLRRTRHEIRGQR